MRFALVLALLALAAPLAAAQPLPMLRQCSSFGCVIVQDTDGDGDYDWGNAAFFVMEQATLNANMNDHVFLWEVVVSTDELGGEQGAAAGEAVEEATGEHLHVVTVAAIGEADLTGQNGGPGFTSADALASVLLINHDDGSAETLHAQYVRVVDTDGDDVPDDVQTTPRLLP